MTKPEKPSDLPRLTDKQFAFVLAVLEGKTLTDAYKASYDTSNTQDHVVWVRASELAADRKVKVWLAQARQQQLADTKVTLQSHTRDLRQLIDECKETGNYGAAVNATVKMGQAHGLYVDRIEMNDTRDMKALLALIDELPQELRGAVRAMAGLPESDTEGQTKH